MFAPVFEQSYTISQRFARCGFLSDWNFCADAMGSGGVLLRVTKTKMPHPQRRFITALDHASKPFQCVCRDRRHFGSRTEMNVSCGLRLRADTLTQIPTRVGDSLGANLWHRRVAVLFDSLRSRSIRKAADMVPRSIGSFPAILEKLFELSPNA